MNILKLLALLHILRLVDSLKILQVAAVFSGSQIMFHYRLAEILTRHGHNVTILAILNFVDIEKSLKPPRGVKELQFRVPLGSDSFERAKKAQKDMAFGKMSSWDFIKLLHDFQGVWNTAFEGLIEADELIEKIRAEKFDIELGHSFDLGPLAVAYLARIPKVVWLSSSTYIIDDVATYYSIPSTPSYIPDSVSRSSDRMDFGERVTNFLLSTTLTLTMQTSINSLFVKEDIAWREPPNQDLPSYWNLIKEVSGFILNGEAFLDFPRPLPWSALFMGSKTKKQTAMKQLDSEWEHLIRGYNGIIVFSFGSIVDTTQMPDEMVKSFMGAFAQFPNYRVIWRFEKTMNPQEIPTNVHISSWIPQADLLRHPKTKLFITHGGYNSLLETSKAGVPVLMIPLWGDQHTNAVRAARFELGIILNDKFSLTKELLHDAIAKLIQDPKYAANCRRLAGFMEDTIMDPGAVMSHRLKLLDKAKWFPSQESAQRLSFVQYHSLDVILFLGTVVFVTVLMSCSSLWKCSLLMQQAARRKK